MSDGAREKTLPEGQGGLFERVRARIGFEGGSVRDDIEGALEEAREDPDFTAQERAILKNVLALHEVRVADVMVPRADIIAIPSAATVTHVHRYHGRHVGYGRIVASYRPPLYSDSPYCLWAPGWTDWYPICRW